MLEVSKLDRTNITYTTQLLNWADALIVGSGVYNGDMHESLLGWVQSWPQVGGIDLSWTVGNAFCTSGGAVAGAQPTLWSMQRAMQTFNAIFAGGTSWSSGTGRLCPRRSDGIVLYFAFFAFSESLIVAKHTPSSLPHPSTYQVCVR